MIEIMNPDFIHKDDRGQLTQLVRDGFNQVNVIFSKKGAIRGGHYHKINEEAFYIIDGKCKVEVSNKQGMNETYEFRKGDMFKICPFTLHGFEYMEDTLLVSMYSKGVELGNGQMDSYTDFD